jgi:mannuronan synthase
LLVAKVDKGVVIMAKHFVYLLAAACLILVVPSDTYQSSSRLFVLLGLFGLWRYSWALVNFVRALWYQHVAYPKMRRRADVAYSNSGRCPKAYFLVTTYKIDTEVTIQVYRSLFAAAAHAPYGARVVASIVEMADQRLIQSVYAQSKCGDVELEFVRIPGTGKRDALACGLAAIKAYQPGADDLVLLVDGDSCVPIDIVQRAAPFFALDSKVGALTTDEICEPRGGKLFQDWYALRFAQRQMMMCSMGLSRRVLTLTGRMSVFRGDLATDPGFIQMVQHDEIHHWRLGNVKFLTGDDKSTWFWLLHAGYHMLYLPDVRSIAMETEPRARFLDSAQVLMTRWFGNMLRNNARAIKLSPFRIGLFTWWSIVDQRLSMWTTLTGPIGALLGAVFVDPLVLLVYVGWVMLSRYFYCLALTVFRPAFPITYPLIAYFNQVFGAGLKTYILFRLDRQRWTRQSIGSSDTSGNAVATLRNSSSVYLQTLSIAGLATVVGLLSGLI